MTDIHTHLLPNMDDGSRSVEESQKMLLALKQQGIDTVVATPHFYATQESPDSFLHRRAQSFARLQQAGTEGLPTVRLGAEVFYYTGISRTEELNSLTVGGTDILLLEMPFCEWTDSMLKEVAAIRREQGLTLLLAHVDRYATRHNLHCMEQMLWDGILLQVNADAFSDRKKQKTVLSLLKKEMVHFVASDCHGLERRPPNVRDAYAILKEKLGSQALARLRYISEEIF